jgi:FMN phosphatase YigB (HAD superfamily)
VQRRRLSDSGLLPLLDAACIVEEKDPSVFESMLGELRADVSRAWSVGNSYGSDVHPAIEIGMRAVWIDAQVWVHERALSATVMGADNPNVFVASRLSDVPRLIGGQPAVRLNR